jgi:hypothetical protein
MSTPVIHKRLSVKFAARTPLTPVRSADNNISSSSSSHIKQKKQDADLAKLSTKNDNLHSLNLTNLSTINKLTEANRTLSVTNKALEQSLDELKAKNAELTTRHAEELRGAAATNRDMAVQMVRDAVSSANASSVTSRDSMVAMYETRIKALKEDITRLKEAGKSESEAAEVRVKESSERERESQDELTVLRYAQMKLQNTTAGLELKVREYEERDAMSAEDNRGEELWFDCETF